MKISCRRLAIIAMAFGIVVGQRGGRGKVLYRLYLRWP